VAPQYQRFVGRAFERVGDDAQPPADLGRRWAEQAVRPAEAGDAQRWLADALDREGDVADTHPVLRLRLAALAAAAGAAADPQALPPPAEGPSAAEAWLAPVLPELRRRFESAWAERVAAGWAERHAQIRNDRERLAALRALPALDGEQRFERLRLQTALEVEVDQREAWAAFNAAQPDHAAALFFEGAERLYHDDEGGVALLERAMALDADFIKPACDRLHAWWVKQQRQADAERVAERWRARDAWEQQRARELHELDVRHALVAADEATCEAVRLRLNGPALRHVARVYLARRVLPSDTAARSYVLGVTLTWWGRLLSRERQVVGRLAAIEWPLHLFVCTLGGSYAKLRKPLRALADSRLV